MELAKQNSNIPGMALNAVVGASGRVGGIDRAFATFAEYDKVFGLTHDVHSYNSLLLAMSKHRHPNVLSMIAIFRDMENKGIAPNELSFSYLLYVMADTNDLSSLNNTISIMTERKICPRGRALRRVAYAAFDLNQMELFEQLKAIMRIAVDRYGRALPPSSLLYAFEKTMKRKMKGLGKPIDKFGTVSSTNERDTADAYINRGKL